MEEFPSFPYSMELSSRSLDPLTELAQSLLVVSDSCDPVDTPLDSSVHGILQARKLEWVAIPFSRGAS